MWLWLQQNRILVPSLSVSGNSDSNTHTCLYKWKMYKWHDHFVTYCVFAFAAGPLQTWREITLSSHCLHPPNSIACFCFGIQKLVSASLSEILISGLQGWTTMWTHGIHFASRGTLCLEWVSCGWMENTPLGSLSALDPTSVAPSSSFWDRYSAARSDISILMYAELLLIQLWNFLFRNRTRTVENLMQSSLSPGCCLMCTCGITLFHARRSWTTWKIDTLAQGMCSTGETWSSGSLDESLWRKTGVPPPKVHSAKWNNQNNRNIYFDCTPWCTCLEIISLESCGNLALVNEMNCNDCVNSVSIKTNCRNNFLPIQVFVSER